MGRAPAKLRNRPGQPTNSHGYHGGLPLDLQGDNRGLTNFFSHHTSPHEPNIIPVIGQLHTLITWTYLLNHSLLLQELDHLLEITLNSPRTGSPSRNHSKPHRPQWAAIRQHPTPGRPSPCLCLSLTPL